MTFLQSAPTHWSTILIIMKHFTILLAVVLSLTTMRAQTLPLNFESGTETWTDFDGGAMTVIDNPQKSGINTSEKVAQMIKGAGQTWGGSWIALEGPIDYSTLKFMSLKVFSPRTNAAVLLKVENADNGAISFEKSVNTTKANEWETLKFDFSQINTANSYSKIVIIIDNGTVGDGSANFTFLIDDIELADGEATVLATPSTSAPSPSVNESNVISIYSDSYTSISGLNLNPGWGQATQVSEVEVVSGDTILKYDLLNYQGTDFDANPQDLSTMDKMHIDVWSPEDDAINIYLINKTEGGSEEKPVALNLTIEEWKSFDIPLSDFTSQGMSVDNVFQLKVDGGNGTPIYLDNIYFYTDQNTSINKIENNLDVYPNPAQDVLHINTENGKIVKVINIAGKVVLEQTLNNQHLDISSLDRGLYLVRVNDSLVKVVKQ